MRDHQFEYKVHQVDYRGHGIDFSGKKKPMILQEQLNRLGMDGWEFVQLHVHSTVQYCIMKRKR